MSSKSMITIIFLIVAVQAADEMSLEASLALSETSLKSLEASFARSDSEHSASMTTIMKGLSTQKAWNVLEKNNLTTPALMQLTEELQGKQSNLRKSTPGKGYSGIGGARKLLNDMIYESMMKYDAEIAKCTEFYASQCAALSVCRGTISQANYVAANSRTLILDSQACISRCEVDIPTRKWDLKVHNRQCADELKKMNDRLAIVLADIEIMTFILTLTDCDAKKSLLQTDVLRCQDCHSKESFITFEEGNLKEQVSKLKSSVARRLMQDTFADLFAGVKSMQSAEVLLQLDETAPVINKTRFFNPPVPRTQVPADPCSDPFAGAPSAATKRRAKCTIAKSPMCYKLQERFLLIQSGIQDERDTLLENIANLKRMCDETRNTLETQIKDDEDLLQECNTKLGMATEKEASAGEEADTANRLHGQLTTELHKQMKSCQDNYVQFETELCALKKIRGELYKMKGSGHSAFFQDCEVSKWEPEECSQDCKRADGPEGEQHLARNVLVHSDGGAKCLPLAAIKKCNLQPCPIDCKLEAWTGWSKCSAECGGGVQQRLREVKVAMAFEGKPCGQTSQTRPCNSEACEEDCTLSSWGPWSHCSKDCDGGTKKRSKQIKAAPRGAGKCPGPWSEERLEYKKCNMFSCIDPVYGHCNIYHKDPNQFYTCDTLPACCDGYLGLGTADDKVQCLPREWTEAHNYKVQCGDVPMKCDKELDVVLLLDGSGSLGQSGWDAEMKAAKTFVKAFSGASGKANLAVILYSGPSTWSGVWKCTGKSNKGVDQETVCKIKEITPFTKDMGDVEKKIDDLKWPQGSTLTSLALMKAKAELSLGRKDSKSIVVVITDGRPLSYRNTEIAARSLRKSARLVWVPVTKFAPLKYIKKWATRRWQENVIPVETFEDLLKSTNVVNHVIASICPMHEELM